MDIHLLPRKQRYSTDCIRKMLQEGSYDCPLLDRDAFASNHTAVVPPARLLNPRNADKKYRYEHFPTKFDPELFETALIIKAKQENLPSPQSYNESSDKEACAKLGPNRTKQEVRTSLAEATKFNEESSLCWPRTLLFYGYSLWFQQLSALVEASQNKIKMLRLAFRILSRMEESNIPFHDQVPYRVVMQLCGHYGKPEMAIQVLRKMRRIGIELNAVTYGVYHKAVMQGDWPSDARLNAISAWDRLRVRLDVAAHFRAYGRLAAQMAADGIPAMAAAQKLSAAQDHYEANSSPSESLKRMSISQSYASLASSVQSSAKSEQEKVMETESFVITVVPVDGEGDSRTANGSVPDGVPKENSNHVEQEVDPLGAATNTPNQREVSSSLMSPSRQKFMREHSASPFAEDADDTKDKGSGRRKKSFKLSGSWFKGIANSPIMTKLMRSHTSEDIESIAKDDTIRSESGGSSMSMSPSLSSIVHQVRKQALKGYDEVINQGNSLLRRSGINNLVLDSNSKNRSMTRDMSAFSNSEEHLDVLDTDIIDPAFQLSSGSNGDILTSQFWMCELQAHAVDSMDDGSIVDVALCTCTPCNNCKSLVYDEELMAGWLLDDANLNAVCPACEHSFVPSLKVTKQKRRSEELGASWYLPFAHSTEPTTSRAPTASEQSRDTNSEGGFADKATRFSVPFLSPLVLRRELETLVYSSPLVLADSSIMFTHPIIFWNLLYYCRRLDVPTHMYTWVSPRVHIRCVYDLPEYHAADEAPIYFANHAENGFMPPNHPLSSRNLRLWQQVVDCLHQTNLFRIMQSLINEHREVKENSIGLRRHFSIYRDILFVALDRFHRSVDREQFDRQFQQEFERLPPRILPLLPAQDHPPKPAVIACRRIFFPLDML